MRQKDTRDEGQHIVDEVEARDLLNSLLKQHAPTVGVWGDKPSWVTQSRARTVYEAQRAMGIDWMGWEDLVQAVPPAYTEYLGAQVVRHLSKEAA